MHLNKNLWKPLLIGTAIVLLVILFKKRAMSAINYYSNGWSSPTSIFTLRGCDPSGCGQGCGHYGASRGDGTHHGLDIIATSGEPIYSPIEGEITAFPYPYASDLNYTGIQITGSGKHEGYQVRMFYVVPNIDLFAQVDSGQEIGIAQDIAAKYSGCMQNHIHLEVKHNGVEVDPESFYSILV